MVKPTGNATSAAQRAGSAQVAGTPSQAAGRQQSTEDTADASGRGDREALERKEQLQAQAQRLESLGQLAGGVAHDFNNLLAVILNYVSFVSEDVAAAMAAAGPDSAEHLESAGADLVQIKKAAERAASLTHQMLVSPAAT
jgi:signal transduction histidine kinase